MPFTAFPIPSAELSTVAADARTAIDAMQNTNAAVNAAIATNPSASRASLEFGANAQVSIMDVNGLPRTTIPSLVSPYPDIDAESAITAAGCTDERGKQHYRRIVNLIKGLGVWSSLENAYLMGSAYQSSSTTLKSITGANDATGTSSFNSYSATFNGTSNNYVFSNVNSGTAITAKTMFVVFKCSRTSSAGNALISNYSGGALRGPVISSGFSPAGGTVLTTMYANASVDGTTLTTGEVALANDKKYAFAAVVYGGGRQHFYAGERAPDRDTLASVWINNANFAIGSNPNNTYYHQGDIVFAGVFNTNLSDGQIFALKTGLDNIFRNTITLNGGIVFEGNSLTAAATGGGTTWPAKLLAKSGWIDITRFENVAGSGHRQTWDIENQYWTETRKWMPLGGQDMIYVLFSGCNDITASVPASDIIASLRRNILMARADGFRVVVMTITPVAASGGGYVWNAGQQAARTTVNDWIISEAPTLGAQAINLDEIGVSYPDFLVPTATTYYTDGLHQNDAGRGLIADKFYAEVTLPVNP